MAINKIYGNEHFKNCACFECTKSRRTDEFTDITKDVFDNSLLASCSTTFEKVLDTLKKKNGDYAGEGFGPFKNFLDPELQLYLDNHNVKLDAVQLGIRIRLKDKWARVNTLLMSDQPPNVTNESIVDAMEDAIGYFAIWKAWLDEKDQK